jgi:hypothetical protein
LAELEELKTKLNWEETQRRKLHNLVQELKVGLLFIPDPI